MTALEDIYSQRILELAADSPRSKRLERPDATATAHSKLCGSTVAIDLNVRDGVISDFGQTVKACLLGQASASIVGRLIVGATPAEMRDVGAKMRRMLKSNGTVPDGKWQDLAVLEPIRDYKARHASTLLVFDAVERALDEIEVKAAQSATA